MRKTNPGEPFAGFWPVVAIVLAASNAIGAADLATERRQIDRYLAKTLPSVVNLRSALPESIELTVACRTRVCLPPAKRCVLRLPAFAVKSVCPGDASADLAEFSLTNDSQADRVYALEYEQNLTLGVGASLSFKPLPPFRVKGIRLQDGVANLAGVEPTTLVLEETRKPLMELLLTPFSIASLREKATRVPPYAIHFRDAVVPRFAGSTSAYFAFLQTKYDEFVEKSSAARSPSLKIPKNVHGVWLTDAKAPRLPRSETFDLLALTMGSLPGSEGWVHNFWVHNLSDLPDLLKSPTQGRGEALDRQIRIRSFAETFGGARHYPYYRRAMDEKNYGKASDIARLMILAKEGGVYRDTDYAFLMDLEELHGRCHFYCGLEDGDAISACNAVIAACPGHPIIARALALIEERFTARPPACLESVLAQRVAGTLFQTGPFLLSQSFFERAGQNGTIDVAMPPQVFYCPDHIVDSGGRIRSREIWPQASLGFHRHFKEWV